MAKTAPFRQFPRQSLRASRTVGLLRFAVVLGFSLNLTKMEQF